MKDSKEKKEPTTKEMLKELLKLAKEKNGLYYPNSNGQKIHKRA